MISTRLLAAAIASVGMTLPAVSYAELFGSGHMAGRSAELQSGTAASINADLSRASESRGNPADASQDHLRQARRQTQDGFNAESLRRSGTAFEGQADMRANTMDATIDLATPAPVTVASSANLVARTNDDNH